MGSRRRRQGARIAGGDPPAPGPASGSETVLRRLARPSLRIRLALGVALPLLGLLSAFSVAHYLRGQRLLEGQLRLTATQLGSVMTGSLRHAMLLNDAAMLQEVLDDIGQMDTIDRVSILDSSGVVRFDTAGVQVGKVQVRSAPGCVECHASPAADRPRTVLLSAPEGTLRIATPIGNESTCIGCHPSTLAHLGVLLADVPLEALEAGLLADLTFDLVASVVAAVVISLGVYLLVHRLIVSRLETMQAPLAAFAAGDLRQRLLVGGPRGDEIGRLAAAFNDMATRLESSLRLERESRLARDRAAYSERERIARDLHDGLAQLLGYVGTKASAVRLHLSKRRPGSAMQHLRQLEEASGEAMTDVRQAILGLRMASQPEADLATRLRTYAEQFSRLSGVPVTVHLPNGPNGLDLGPEAESELLHIVQEALSNVRKHAGARQAWLSVEVADGRLELTVADDGRGFDANRGGGRPDAFGLASMRQRAESVGAEIQVESRPGHGTRIVVRMDTPRGPR